MKIKITLLFLLLTATVLFAQSNQKGESHSASQNAVIRIEGSVQNGWVKGDNDASAGTNAPAPGNENVSYNATSEGIYVTILSGTNKIKLFALSGQMLFNGVLTQGRFLITARTGIYFLRVNSKNYKVVCK